MGPAAGTVRRVLFTTSNGTGLGHLTRGMAIARRLPPVIQPVFLTLSQALPVTVREGFHGEFLFSHEYGSMDGATWNVHYERRFEHVVATYRPDLVVFDGVYPYVGLVRALQRLPDVRVVWCRRALWKPGSPKEHLRSAGLFHAVLEPGEYAASADRGPTVARRAEAHQVAPIVYLDPGELLPRREAAAALGLDPDREAVLVQLGSGSLRSIETTAGQVVDRLRRVDGLQVTVAESVIGGAPMPLPDGVHRARVYPLARYAAAFDFAVAAPGYNLFHEALAYRLPTLFVPKRDATRDDQEARARWAMDHGVGLWWRPDDHDGLDAALNLLLDEAERTRLRSAAAMLPSAVGGQEAANWLAGAIGVEPAVTKAGTP